jgi:GMP synthase (glutamine-hydrolysing)
LGQLGIGNVVSIDASEQFLTNLKGVSDPEIKRKIIANTFFGIFTNESRRFKKDEDIEFLGQGTIYPDRIESGQASKAADRIKTHHNIETPPDFGMKLVEPLKWLYKDEVRELGQQIGISDELLNRHPFPGPGLAVRILGEVTSEKLEIVRDADSIFIDELKEAKLYDQIWQAFVALLPLRAVGVKGDARSYDYLINLRAVTTFDAMTADWAEIPNDVLRKISSRILNEVSQVGRVSYDISQKPPATIEYE